MNYDFSNFHKGCVGVIVVSGPDGLHVVCPACRVSANMEAISAKVSPADACLVGSLDRKPIGDQSLLVNKGEVIKQ